MASKGRKNSGFYKRKLKFKQSKSFKDIVCEMVDFELERLTKMATQDLNIGCCVDNIDNVRFCFFHILSSRTYPFSNHINIISSNNHNHNLKI